MGRLLLIGLMLALVVGCKKGGTKPAKDVASGPRASAGGNDMPVVHPSGVVVPPTGGAAGGGGGGAYQAVRTAAKRTVNLAQLKDIQLFITNASLENGKMPTREETAAVLQKEAPQIYKQVQDGSIVLTGTRSREHVWAYTADPQSVAGEHLVVTSSSVDRMAAQTLKQRLRQEQGQ